MKKIFAILSLIAILTLSLSLFSCTDGEEKETEHNIIIDDGEGDGLDETGDIKEEDGVGAIPLG